MTIQHIHDTEHADVAEVVEDTDPIVAIIRHEIKRAHEQADRHSADAGHLRRQAQRLEDLAMECRLREQRWQRHLELATSEADNPYADLINDRGDAQTALIPRPRTRYPLVHPNGSKTPHLACTGCGTALREATAEEVEEIAGGGEVQARCDACKARVVALNGGNPYPTPPDAA
jgi:hypothetical protein